jgi:hypothetical protein
MTSPSQNPNKGEESPVRFTARRGQDPQEQQGVAHGCLFGDGDGDFIESKHTSILTPLQRGKIL